jgi:cytochrome c peroxidase
LSAAVAAFRLPPNPHRTAAGELTSDARRGQSLFRGKAACAACHAGPHLGGAGLRAAIGTTAAGLELDVPHLAGVYDTAPYLHDGRAATLEEVFTRHNPASLHGQAHALTPQELAELLAYVREM